MRENKTSGVSITGGELQVDGDVVGGDKNTVNLVFLNPTALEPTTRYLGVEAATLARSNLAALQRKIYGRTPELEQLDSFVRDRASGRLELSGDGGTGKSALFANWILATRNPEYHFIYHFFSPATSRTSDALLSITRQLYDYYGIDRALLPRLEQSRDTILGLIQERGAQSGQKLVIVIDALDEAAEPFNLPVPAQLPDGIFIAQSSRQMDRHGHGLVSKLERDAPGTVKIALRPLATADLKLWLADSRADTQVSPDDLEQLAKQILASSGGLPLFVDLILQDISDADQENRPTSDIVSGICSGLTEYIHGALDQLARTAEPLLGGRYIRLLALLAIARSPLTANEIIEVSDISTLELHALPRSVTRWLKVESDETGGRLYAMGHALIASELRKVLRRESTVAEGRLRDYCGKWRENRSRYALLNYASHLAEGDFNDQLIELLCGSRHWLVAKRREFGHDEPFVADIRLARAAVRSSVGPGTDVVLLRLFILESVVKVPLLAAASEDQTDLKKLVWEGKRPLALMVARTYSDIDVRVKRFVAIASECLRAGQSAAEALREATREVFVNRASVAVSTVSQLIDALVSADDLPTADSVASEAAAGIVREVDAGKKRTAFLNLLGARRIGIPEALYQDYLLLPEDYRLDVGFAVAKKLSLNRQVKQAEEVVSLYGTVEDRLYGMCSIAEGAAERGDFERADAVVASLEFSDDPQETAVIAIPSAAFMAAAGSGALVNRLMALPDLDIGKLPPVCHSKLAEACLLTGRIDDAIHIADQIGNSEIRARLLVSLAKSPAGQQVPKLMQEALKSSVALSSLPDLADVLQLSLECKPQLSMRQLRVLTQEALANEWRGAVEELPAHAPLVWSCVQRMCSAGNKESAVKLTLAALSRLGDAAFVNGFLADTKYLDSRLEEEYAALFGTPSGFAIALALHDIGEAEASSRLTERGVAVVRTLLGNATIPVGQYDGSVYLLACVLRHLGRTELFAELSKHVLKGDRNSWLSLLCGLPSGQTEVDIKTESAVQHLAERALGLRLDVRLREPHWKALWNAACALHQSNQVRASEEMLSQLLHSVGAHGRSSGRLSSRLRKIGGEEANSESAAVLEQFLFALNPGTNPVEAGSADDTRGPTEIEELALEILAGKARLGLLADAKPASPQRIFCVVMALWAILEQYSSGCVADILRDIVRIAGWKSGAFEDIARSFHGGIRPDGADPTTRQNDPESFNWGEYADVPDGMGIGPRVHGAIEFALGCLVERNGHYPAAGRSYSSALTRCPDQPEYIRKACYHLILNGQFHEASVRLCEANLRFPAAEFGYEQFRLALLMNEWSSAHDHLTSQTSADHGLSKSDRSFWNGLAHLAVGNSDRAAGFLADAVDGSVDSDLHWTTFWHRMAVGLRDGFAPDVGALVIEAPEKALRVLQLAACRDEPAAARLLSEFFADLPDTGRLVRLKSWLVLLSRLLPENPAPNAILTAFDEEWRVRLFARKVDGQA